MIPLHYNRNLPLPPPRRCWFQHVSPQSRRFRRAISILQYLTPRTQPRTDTCGAGHRTPCTLVQQYRTCTITVHTRLRRIRDRRVRWKGSFLVISPLFGEQVTLRAPDRPLLDVCLRLGSVRSSRPLYSCPVHSVRVLVCEDREIGRLRRVPLRRASVRTLPPWI